MTTPLGRLARSDSRRAQRVGSRGRIGIARSEPAAALSLRSDPGTKERQMRVFVSYARQDRGAVDALVVDLERLGHQAWYDDDLSGGQAWWNEILRQVQACDAMLFVLSSRSAESEACKLEAGYAAGLARAIVPLRIEPDVSVRLLPPFLAERQLVDYASRDVDSIIALTRALSTVTAGTPLPDPMPEPPAVPFSYLTGLAARVSMQQVMTPEEQWTAIAELRGRLADEDQRADVAKLLRVMRSRRDVLAIVAQEIDHVLTAAPDPRPEPPPTAVVPVPPPDPEPQKPQPAPSVPTPQPTPTPTPRPTPPIPSRVGPSRTVLLTAVGVVVALVAVVVLFTGRDDDDTTAEEDGTEEDGTEEDGTDQDGEDTDGGGEQFFGEIHVPATSAWTDTGIELFGGEVVEISASGEIGDNTEVPDDRFEPGGEEREDPDKHPGDPYLEFPHAALLGHIGDGDVFEVGYGTVIEDAPPGQLYLGINDGNFDDNSDKFLVDITVKGQ